MPCVRSNCRQGQKNDTAAKEHSDVDGNTQDMLQFIDAKGKVCLVTLDYAGLSTNCADVHQFLLDYPQIERITVDLLPYINEVTMYDSKQLLEDPEKLKVFECRERTSVMFEEQ
ncbi:unnamed protein product [Absidia cylindrospora]